jgi:2-methylcitrate synthase/citrate synthase II
MMTNIRPAVHKGLAGVVADVTAVSTVNEDTNSLLYRGYTVEDLASGKSFEEVAYLLWKGELPDTKELSAFQMREHHARSLPPGVRHLIESLPPHAHPMDILRTAVSGLGAFDPLWADSSREALLTKAENLFAVLPTIIASIQRRRRGEEMIEPRDDLNYSENFLWMSFGEAPDPIVVDAFQVSMILYAEHSFNASTFTARVITSTMSDFYSAVTGAIGALKGPLHGGANEAVMATFEEIGGGDSAKARADKWLDEALMQKRKIMGFGHRVYKDGDSRVPRMRRALIDLVDHFDRPDMMELYVALERGMSEKKNIMPNLDYPSGPAYHLMGFDTEVFTPLFVASRITGWAAHIMEQAEDNSLIRPLSSYNGTPQRTF